MEELAGVCKLAWGEIPEDSRWGPTRKGEDINPSDECNVFLVKIRQKVPRGQGCQCCSPLYALWPKYNGH